MILPFVHEIDIIPPYKTFVIKFIYINLIKYISYIKLQYLIIVFYYIPSMFQTFKLFILSSFTCIFFIFLLLNFPQQVSSHTPIAKIEHAKGIVIDIEDTFFRTATGSNDNVVTVSPNVTTRQSWIYAHSIANIQTVTVIDVHGVTLAVQEIGAAAFHLYTGEMDPGQYYILMNVEEQISVISCPIVIQS